MTGAQTTTKTPRHVKISGVPLKTITIDRRPISATDRAFYRRHLNSPVSLHSSASSHRYPHQNLYIHNHENGIDADLTMSSRPSSSAKSPSTIGPFIYRGVKTSDRGNMFLKTGFVNQIESDDSTTQSK